MPKLLSCWVSGWSTTKISSTFSCKLDSSFSSDDKHNSFSYLFDILTSLASFTFFTFPKCSIWRSPLSFSAPNSSKKNPFSLPTKYVVKLLREVNFLIWRGKLDSEMQQLKDSRCRDFKRIKLFYNFWRQIQLSKFNTYKFHNLHSDSRLSKKLSQRFKYLRCFKWPIEDNSFPSEW